MNNDKKDQVGNVSQEERLLLHQLESSVPAHFGTERRRSLVRGTIELFKGFRAKDRFETLLLRQVVILNNLATECLHRGLNTSKPEARAIDLRSGLKAVSLITEICRLVDSRGQRGQQRADTATALSSIDLPPEQEQEKAHAGAEDLATNCKKDDKAA